MISAHTAIEGSGDAGIAVDSSRPDGSTLAPSVLKPHVLTGGYHVGAWEIGAVSTLSSAAGVLFSGSSQLVAVSKPQFGTSSVGGKGSIPAPKSLQDPGNSTSGFPKSGHVSHGLLGAVLSGSSLGPRVGPEDTRESAAVDVGSPVGLGNMSGCKWDTREMCPPLLPVIILYPIRQVLEEAWLHDSPCHGGALFIWLGKPLEVTAKQQTTTTTNTAQGRTDLANNFTTAQAR